MRQARRGRGCALWFKHWRAATAAPALVVAADNRRAKPGSSQELTYGAGAAAFLTGHDEPMARYLGSYAASAPFVDHFRQSGAPYDYYWEERWIRDAGVVKLVPEAVKQLLTQIDVPAARVAWFGLAGAPSGGDALVAAALGIPRERLVPDLQGTVGDTGAAHALLLLAGALERATAGDVVVIAAFGLGCEAVAFEVSHPPAGSPYGLEAALGRKTVENSYLKMLSFRGELQLDWGPRSETVIKASLEPAVSLGRQSGLRGRPVCQLRPGAISGDAELRQLRCVGSSRTVPALR